MAQVIETVDVQVPIRTAYDQWTQFEDFPKFLSFVDEITQQGEEKQHWKVTIGGQTREFDVKITEQLPDERVAWNSIEGTDHAGVVTFHKLSDSETRVTVQLDWAPEGFIEKAGALVGVDDVAIKADLKNFKQFIEERGAATGAWRGEVPRD